MLNSTQRIRNLSEQPDNDVHLIAIDEPDAPEFKQWTDAVMLCLSRLDQHLTEHHTRIYNKSSNSKTFTQQDAMDLIRDGYLVMATRDETLVGLLAVTTDEQEKIGEVTHVYVQEELWGKGIAAMMLGKAEALGREKGLTHLKIQTYSNNEQANKAYSKSGYIPSQQTVTKRI